MDEQEAIRLLAEMYGYLNACVRDGDRPSLKMAAEYRDRIDNLLNIKTPKPLDNAPRS